MVAEANVNSDLESSLKSEGSVWSAVALFTLTGRLKTIWQQTVHTNVFGDLYWPAFHHFTTAASKNIILVEIQWLPSLNEQNPYILLHIFCINQSKWNRRVMALLCFLS